MLDQVGAALWEKSKFTWKPNSLEAMYVHWTSAEDRVPIFAAGQELVQKRAIRVLGAWVDHEGGCDTCVENRLRAGDKLWLGHKKSVTCILVPLHERVWGLLGSPCGAVEHALEAWH